MTRWKAEVTRSASSIGAFSKAVADFTAHLKHSDPRLVVKSDVVNWAMALRERSLSPKTINDTYLAAIRALYNLALRSDLVTINPVEGFAFRASAVLAKRCWPTMTTKWRRSSRC